jgi:hypothetical protein
MMSNNIAILPGGSSPHVMPYKPVYDMIISEAAERGYNAKLHSFVRDGQSPDFGYGLELITNSLSVRHELENYPEKSTLFCKCYGCFVGAYLLALYPDSLKSFERIVFYAPTPYWRMWQNAYTNRNSIGEWNNKYGNEKGCIFSDIFFTTMKPIECFGSKFPADKKYILGCGDNDPSCTPSDMIYFLDTIKRTSKIDVSLHIIEGAKHTISPDDSDGIKEEYFKLIFGT